MWLALTLLDGATLLFSKCVVGEVVKMNKKRLTLFQTEFCLFPEPTLRDLTPSGDFHLTFSIDLLKKEARITLPFPEFQAWL